LWLQCALCFERLGDWENAYLSYREVAEIHSSSISDLLLERVASKWPVSPQIERYLLELAMDPEHFRLPWEALLRMGPRIVSRVLKELENPDFLPKERLLTLLGQLKDPRSTLSLLNFLPYYPIPVLQALRSLKDPRACATLTQLYTKEENPFIRRMILWSLGRISGVSSLLLFLQAGWEDEHPQVRFEARECLENLTRFEKNLVPFLQGFLKSTTLSVRLGTIWTLSLIPQEEALYLLIQALSDPAHEVQLLAIESLGKLRLLESVNPLMKLLEEDPSLTQPILEALGKIGYRPPLRKALRDPDPWTKFLGAKFLFLLGEEPGRFMLELLSHHIDRRLSWAAKQMLRWGC
ncbi:MAG: HEAT repeat domain-containing protein, partial [Planctomycetota bacterium]